MTSVVPLALLNGLDEVDLSNNKISEAKVGTAAIAHLPDTDPLRHSTISFLPPSFRSWPPSCSTRHTCARWTFAGTRSARSPSTEIRLL